MRRCCARRHAGPCSKKELPPGLSDMDATSDIATASAARSTGDPRPLTADSTNDRPEIIRLPQHPAHRDTAPAKSLSAEWDRERRKLQQAVELLRRARQKLYEQSLQNEQQQQRLLSAIREEWRHRQRQLERQLAVTALQHARSELAAEWEQLELEKQRWAEEKAAHTARQAEREEQQTALQHQLTDARRKLAAAELEIVRQQMAWTEDQRRWNEERAEAQRIISELLEEMETSSGFVAVAARAA